MSRTDLALFFPPGGLKFYFPELGIPQLTADLRARGFTVTQHDLNAQFLARYLKEPSVRQALRKRFAARKRLLIPKADIDQISRAVDKDK